MNTSTLQNQITALMAMVIILFGISIYLNHHALNIMDDLTSSHQELRGKVSGIEIKGDDTANQQEAIIRDLYRIEYLDAIDIAHQAGFNHTQLVNISGYQEIDTVRLRNHDDSEIEVNIDTKVITTYSPQ